MNDSFQNVKTAADVIVIGGGIIGVAVARAYLKRHPNDSLILLEKEWALAQHTSGHNSGVLHAGYNQKPGTLKARLCVEGNRMIREYCDRSSIPILKNGILIVAARPEEFPVLDELYARGTANGVPGLEAVDEAELKRREPNVIGLKALWAPSGAAVDSVSLVKSLAEDAKRDGAIILTRQTVQGIVSESVGFRVQTSTAEFACRRLINCAGLHADRVAHMVGAGLDYTIVPFRGEYFTLRGGINHLVSAMIYPVPDLAFPFLGIHWTKTFDGDLKVGPNAILAFGRESYRFWDIRWSDCLEMLTHPNVWKMVENPDFRRLVREQIQTSLSPHTFLTQASRLVKGVTPNDFQPGPAGIRAQLVDRDGHLVDDLVIEKKGDSLHVLNAISPGMTCSMAFAEHLCDLL